jgi:hypothetical protein
MADTPVATNNKSISFGRKVEREMSAEELDKRRNAEGEPVNGEPAAVRKPKKMSRNMRKSAKRAIKRGMISEKAAKKHLGED